MSTGDPAPPEMAGSSVGDRSNGREAEPGLAEQLLQASALLRQKGLLRLHRIELAARRAGWISLVVLWLGFTVAVATVAAIVLLFRGTAAMLTAWTGSGWGGDITTGAAFFAGTAALALVFAGHRRRLQLDRLQRRFGE